MSATTVSVQRVSEHVIRERIADLEDLLIRRMSEAPWYLNWVRGDEEHPMSARGFIATFYGKGDFILALDGDTLAGFAIGVRLDEELVDHLRLRRFGVEAGDYYNAIGIIDLPYRSQGVYGQMVSHRLELAEDCDVQWLRTHVDQTTVWGYYRDRHGFEIVDEYEDVDYGQRTLRRYVMRRARSTS